MPKQKLYLIDGTSLCYRSHFALTLSNSSGLPTGATYGFYKTLNKIISEQKPDLMAICFDVSRETYRQKKYKDYKIQRPPLPDALGEQFPVIKKLIKAGGIKAVEKKGFEADDLIASLCKTALAEGKEVVVVSSDKDLYQLLSNRGVFFYNYKDHKFFDKDKFLEKYGFEPSYMIDYLSLAGDASDNIPGAKGIGKVGAAKLIKEFGSIANIFSNLNKMNPKVADKLKESKEKIILSKELVELSEPELGVEMDQLRLAQPDKKELTAIFSQLDFKIPKDGFFGQPLPDLNALLTKGKIKDNLKFQLKKKINQLVYFINQEKAYVYLPADDLTCKGKIEELEKLFAETSLKKVTFNLKEQLRDNSKLNLQGRIFDLKIASYLIDSSLSDYNLTSLVSLFLEKHYSQIEIQAYPYFIWSIYKILNKKIEEEKLNNLFYEIEMPLVKVLCKMEATGISIDLKQLKKVLKEVNCKIKETKETIFNLAQKKFNLNSPKQLQEVLFDNLGIKPLKKTKTGYSTNEEVLKELAQKYPVAQNILFYREISKLKNTYLDPLNQKAKEGKGKLFAHFNQTGTQTGRLSSFSPNLQSIPAKGGFSAGLRKAFISSYRDGLIVCGDYSQIELRILAHLSGDKTLLDAFGQGLDVHKFTASLLFGINQEKVKDFQRNIAKKVNFGIVYGMSSYGLAKELRMDLEEAEKFIENYFARYPGVKKYIEKTISQAEDKGYVETIFKRKRIFPRTRNFNFRLKDFAKRQAVNAPIQGSCADIIKLAMVKIDQKITEANIQAKLIMQIHDELVFDCKKNSLEELTSLMKACMENCLSLAVPLPVNLKAGKNWADLKKIKL